MDLPVRYKLRAIFELRFSDVYGDDMHQALTDSIAAIEAMENTETLIPGAHLHNALNGNPLLHVQQGIKPGLMKISSFSISTGRDILVAEAMDVSLLLAHLLVNKKGHLIDCLSMNKRSFEEISTHHPVGLKDLYQFHAVKHTDFCFLHTHGLAKFACPDLEWHLPMGIDPYRAAQIVDQIIDDMVYSNRELKSGGFIHTHNPKLRLRVKCAAAKDDLHYAENETMRISVEPGSDAHRVNAASYGSVREEYFYGCST